MWTVVVEVHLGSKGATFQVGSFIDSQDAAAFADNLEWEIGENKITASILRSENLFEWLVKMVTNKHKQERREVRAAATPDHIVYPPCEALTEEDFE